MLKTSYFKVENFSGRNVCIAGVGRLFYEEGFPVSLSVAYLANQRIETSILHVADECLKNGWSAKTTFTKLKADFDDAIEGENINESLLQEFCYAEYEKQRELIFDYLFSNADYKEWLIDKLQAV